MAVAAAPLSELTAVAQPVTMAGDRLLPVLPPLRPLLPGGGLRRGSVVTVSGFPGGGGFSGGRFSGGGSTSLALSLLAGASEQGSWCAAVGLPALGLAAAAELGVALERFPVVASPLRGSGPGGWAWVVAALLDSFEVVLAGPPPGLRAADARRLTARVRERGAVLVASGGAGWPEPAEVRLALASAVWDGLGRGHGRLRGRQVEVVAGGRGAAARERRVRLWLPHPDGGVRQIGAGAGEGTADARGSHARRVVS